MLSSLIAPHSAHSQHGEDVLLLPTLLKATGGSPGTFVEIGALDGVTYSNTRTLELCYGWRGLLIEGNPANFRKLISSERNATKVHAAVCAGKSDGSDDTITFTREGGQLAGAVDFIPDLNSKISGKALNASTVSVPCRPLTRIMRDAGFPTANLLSLDVEGAEAEVLAQVQPAAFQVVLVEWVTDWSPHRVNAPSKRDREAAAQKLSRVHRLLRGGGLHAAEQLHIPGSRVYLREDVQEVFVNDTWLKRVGAFRTQIAPVTREYEKQLRCLLSTGVACTRKPATRRGGRRA